jgi:gluconate:H+ symporter, GntP family
LKLDAGTTILAGLLAGIIPVWAGWQAAKWINRRMEIPLREAPGATIAELSAVMDKKESDLPSFFASIVPVLLPIVLIAGASFATASKPFKAGYPLLFEFVAFIGNRNIALLVGAIIAIAVVMRQRKWTLAKVCDNMGPTFETAGVIILITAAGGAFGGMLRNAGVGDAIKTAAEGKDINLIFLSWLVAAVIRVAQGSATVAMLTTAAMIYPLMAAGLPYNPAYIFCAIGFGAMISSWMNDSGFWVVGKLSGFTEKETLKTWTVVLTVMSIAGLIQTLILAKALPFK